MRGKVWEKSKGKSMEGKKSRKKYEKSMKGGRKFKGAVNLYNRNYPIIQYSYSTHVLYKYLLMIL